MGSCPRAQTINSFLFPWNFIVSLPCFYSKLDPAQRELLQGRSSVIISVNYSCYTKCTYLLCVILGLCYQVKKQDMASWKWGHWDVYIGHSTDGWRDCLILGQWTPLMEEKIAPLELAYPSIMLRMALKDKMSPRGSINLALPPCSFQDKMKVGRHLKRNSRGTICILKKSSKFFILGWNLFLSLSYYSIFL